MIVVGSFAIMVIYRVLIYSVYVRERYPPSCRAHRYVFSIPHAPCPPVNTPD